MTVLNGVGHYRRTTEAVSRESEILRLIELWRGRGLTYREISERLGEKGHKISESSARKLQCGGAVRIR